MTTNTIYQHLKGSASLATLGRASSTHLPLRKRQHNSATEEEEAQDDIPRRSKSTHSISKTLNILRKRSDRSSTSRQPATPTKTVRILLSAVPHVNNSRFKADQDVADPTVATSRQTNSISYPPPPTAPALLVPLSASCSDGEFATSLNALDLAARQSLMFADERAFQSPWGRPFDAELPPVWDTEALAAAAQVFLTAEMGWEVVYRCKMFETVGEADGEWWGLAMGWERERFLECLRRVSEKGVQDGVNISADEHGHGNGEQDGHLRVHLMAKFSFKHLPR